MTIGRRRVCLHTVLETASWIASCSRFTSAWIGQPLDDSTVALRASAISLDDSSGSMTPRERRSGPARSDAGVAVEGQRHHQDPVLRQVAAVAQHDLLDVPHPQAVDEHQAGADLFAALDRLGVELDGLTVLDHDDAVVGDAGLARELRVLQQLPVLAVDRDEEARPDRHRASRAARRAARAR